MPTLVLASASPRRAALLREAGFDPVFRPAEIAEDPLQGEAPRQMVVRLAVEKGTAAAATQPPGSGAVVLAADTAVVVGRTALGKPVDADDAARMLRLLSGRGHEVLTGVFVRRLDNGRQETGVDSTLVTFRTYGEDEIRAYVDTGEPLDKAGAYAIQGRGAALVSDVRGSWTNVVGLPMELVRSLFARLDLPWTDA